MQDLPRHQGMRRLLIDELRRKGITNEDILAAFDAVPRHFFLDTAFESQAYSNMAFQIGSGQTISHPYTVAFQTALLELKKGEKVLEIGTGSGFQTSILCKLGANVVSIERHKDLYLKAKKIIDFFGFRAKLFLGDGYEGKATFGPYDKVLVTCGAPLVPEALCKQLKIGGIMVIPVGEGKNQVMMRYVKVGEDQFTIENFGDFSFVPMLEKIVHKK